MGSAFSVAEANGPTHLTMNSVQSYAMVSNSRLSDIFAKLSGCHFPFATRSFADLGTIDSEPFKVAIGKKKKKTFQACLHCQLRKLQGKDLKCICRSLSSPQKSLAKLLLLL